MNQSNLSRWLKAILIGIGLCGLIVCFYVLPACGRDFQIDYPEFASWFWPWMIFLWLTGVPCFAVLWFAWKIAVSIGEDKSFTLANAGYLRMISLLAAGDTLFFFAGNIVFLFLNMSHPGVLLASLLICFAGVAIALVAACLSHLVKKASDLQEQSDLTV